MAYSLRSYHAPLVPDCRLCPAPEDAIAPPSCHAMSIDPEYFRIFTNVQDAIVNLSRALIQEANA